MPTEIDYIDSRRTKKGRVEYLVKWAGYGEQGSTWETRIDLVKEGHRAEISKFESERKSKSKSSRSTTPPSSRGESTSSKSPGRKGRSRTSSSAEKSPKSSSKKSTKATPKKTSTRSSRSRTPKRATPARRSATPSRRRSTESTLPMEEDKKEEEDSDVSEEAELIQSRTTSAPEEKIICTTYSPLLFHLFLLFGSILLNALVPKLKESPLTDGSPRMAMAVQMLEKTTALPSLVCLLLVLQTKDTRAYPKWVAVCLVWRTAAEVLLQLPDPVGLYRHAALGSIGVADFAILLAICSIVGGSQPKGDALTQSLGALGTLILFGSDGILFLLEGTPFYDARFVTMSMSLVMIVFSSLLQTPLQQNDA